MRTRQTAVWAYGTLRPGCGNDRMLGDYIDLGIARLPGWLYYHTCGMFPVYQRSKGWGYGEVVGNVLLASDEDIARVIAMEVFAGYDVEWTQVQLGEDVWDVITFPWRREVDESLQIPSGDWYDADYMQPERMRP